MRLPNLSNKAKLAAVAAIVAVPAVALPIAFATKDGGLPGVGSGGDGAAYAFPVTPDHIPDTPVRVNQVGYLPDGPKRATVVTDATTPLPWQLKDEAGTVVASGETAPRGMDPSSGQACTRSTSARTTSAAPGTPSRPTARRACPFDLDPKAYRQLRDRRDDVLLPAAQRHRDRRHARPRLRPRRRPRRRRPQPAATPTVPCQPGVCDYTLDVTGGWYDAGDHGKYVVNGGIAVAQLMSSTSAPTRPRRRR